MKTEINSFLSMNPITFTLIIISTSTAFSIITSYINKFPHEIEIKSYLSMRSKHFNNKRLIIIDLSQTYLQVMIWQFIPKFAINRDA